MASDDGQVVGDLETVLVVKDRFEWEWMAVEGVFGLGVGAREIDGQLCLAVVIYATQAIPWSELPHVDESMRAEGVPVVVSVEEPPRQL